MLDTMKRLALFIMLALGSSLVTGAHAGEFTDAQKVEIGKLVREYLLKNPEVLRDAFRELERRTQANKAKKARTAIKQNADLLFHAKGDLIAGNPDGKITLVEFFDYNCGFCKRSFPDILKLAESEKELKIVIKEFPILGPGSLAAAKASIAAGMQGKYWEFHNQLMPVRGAIDEKKALAVAAKLGLDMDKLKKDMESSRVREILTRNLQLAEALNIQGTPAFFIDDQFFPGAVGFSQLSKAIAKVRDNGGCKVC